MPPTPCRWTVADDARGVGEPLQETWCGTTQASACTAGGLIARGRFAVVAGLLARPLSSDDDRRVATTEWRPMPRLLRAAAHRLNDPLVLSFAALQSTPAPVAAAASAAATTGLAAPLHDSTWSGLVAPLPRNVHLLTLMRMDEADSSRLLLRLAHVFQVRLFWACRHGG
jgi:hypothetical protein